MWPTENLNLKRHFHQIRTRALIYLSGGVVHSCIIDFKYLDLVSDFGFLTWLQSFWCLNHNRDLSHNIASTAASAHPKLYVRILKWWDTPLRSNIAFNSLSDRKSCYKTLDSNNSPY